MKRACAAGLVMLMLLLSACGSDYPVVNRKLDVSEFINACFEGTGFGVSVEEAEVCVSAVGDRMRIEMGASADTAAKIREKIRTAGSADFGMVGVWTGELDITPPVCESFESIEGLDLRGSIGEIMIPATLTFTQDGYYFIRFSPSDIERADKMIKKGAAGATKEFLSQSGGVGKVVVRAVSDSTLEAVLGYVVAVVDQMLENGGCGSYSSTSSKISFDAEYSFDYIMTEKSLTLTGRADSGLLACICPGPVLFEKTK